MPEALFVLGMHRSGTSAVTRVLNLLGAYLGSEDDLLPAQQDNPSGFWERSDLHDLHDAVLSRLGRTWDTVLSLPAGWHRSPEIEPFKEALERVVETHFSGRRLWAVKDPRLSLLFPLWDDVLGASGIEHGCVMIFRNPLETAQSLARRNGFSMGAGFSLWLNYNLEMLANTEQCPRCLVNFGDFLDDWRLLLECSEQLGFVWPRNSEEAAAEVSGFLNRDLVHAQASREEVARHGPPRDVQALYELMLEAAGAQELLDSKTLRDKVTRMAGRWRQQSEMMMHDMEQRNQIVASYRLQLDKSEQLIGELKDRLVAEVEELRSGIEALRRGEAQSAELRNSLASQLAALDTKVGNLLDRADRTDQISERVRVEVEAQGVRQAARQDELCARLSELEGRFDRVESFIQEHRVKQAEQVVVLQQDLASTRTLLASRDREAREALQEAETARTLLSQVLESRSWKMTAPLRGAVSLVKRAVGRR